ncbi:hypothetical protein JCM10212_000009 [Sporobolomyces blumeae]
MSRSPNRPRRSKPLATNSLILVLPRLLFSPALLPLFHAHFGSYGNMLAWTPLERLGRVLVVYDEVADSATAKHEMDGFVWEDDHADEQAYASTSRSRGDGHAGQPLPLRAFFGPALPVPLPASLSSTLLAVPTTSRNFLISPPGSPPVGWEQIEEDAPNKQLWHEQDEVDPQELGETFNDKWANELVRALRFLSVDSDGPEVPEDAEDERHEGTRDPGLPKTQVILPPSADSPRPAVVVSTPPASGPPSQTATPPPGAARISSVKATIESMLVRKRSMSDLRNSPSGSSTPGSLGSSLPGGDSGGGPRITPTARPPLATESL